jgi:type VI secretion system protein ImpB
MPKDSINKKLGRVRPPRVHITYDVYTGGAIEKKEIPFVVGVLADLSGQPKEALPKLGERRFVEIDRDNFNQVMAKQAPRIVFRVDNKLAADNSKLGVELQFKSLADFQPQNVVEQVEPLKKLLDLRTKLANLRTSLYGNDKAVELLQQAVAKTEALRKSEATKAESSEETKAESSEVKG